MSRRRGDWRSQSSSSTIAPFVPSVAIALLCPSFQLSRSSRESPGSSPATRTCLAEGAALARALARDDGRDTGPPQGVRRGDRGGREAVLGGEHVVAAELAHDRADDRLFQPLAEDGKGGHEGEPDHQGGSGGGGPRRVPGRVGARQRPGCPADLRRRPAEHVARAGARCSGRSSRRRRRPRAPRLRAGAGACRSEGPRGRRRGRRARARRRRRRVRRQDRSGRGGSGGSTEPSRTAAIGGTRVARTAGHRLATTVTAVPTTSETITVRVVKTSEVKGSLTPSALKSASSPLARPSPTNEPDRRGDEAGHEPLEHHCAAHLPRARARARAASRTRASAGRR